MSTRLYKITECKKRYEKDALGSLSLGAFVDFNKMTIKFWSRPSSTFEHSEEIGKCIKRELAGLPLYSIEHNYDQYRLFLTVDFIDYKKRAAELALKKRRSKLVPVIKDKVNIRMAPVDGASIGRISSDSRVYLLKRDKKTGWCRIITPKDNEGWMICDALGL
jgi:hypothetical protein